MLHGYRRQPLIERHVEQPFAGSAQAGHPPQQSQPQQVSLLPQSSTKHHNLMVLLPPLRWHPSFRKALQVNTMYSTTRLSGWLCYILIITLHRICMFAIATFVLVRSCNSIQKICTWEQFFDSHIQINTSSYCLLVCPLLHLAYKLMARFWVDS